MPAELLDTDIHEGRIGPEEVYVTLRDLIALQHDARGFSFLPKFAVQSILSGRHRSKLRGRGLDFDEVRQYVPGDDIRNIDWKVTARVGETHSKVFTEERERPVFLVVDQSSSMFFGSASLFKSVVAAHLAAISCWRVLNVGDRIGGLVFNEVKVDYVGPKRDGRTVQRFLSLVTAMNQQLAAKKVDATYENPLNHALQRACNLVSHDYLVCVISDFSTANSLSLKLLTHMRRNNDVLVAHISDPAEFEIKGENIVLSDGYFQTIVHKNRNFRKEFKKNERSFIDRMKVDLKKYGIPFLPFHTLEEPAKQLRGLLTNNTRRK